MIPWTKKYEPQDTTEIIGQENTIKRIQTEINKKKPLLLYGPTGVGKTSLIHAIAKERGLEIFEMNSSDVRNKQNIQESLAGSMLQQSLFSKGKIILLDDIDAMSGRKDHGGLTEILGLIEKCHHQIFFTCIDPWESKLSTLRKKSILLECKQPKKEEIIHLLKNICAKENISYNEEDLSCIAKEARGDIRAAINDLQTNSTNKTLKIEDRGERDQEQTINLCLRKILKGQDWNEAHNIFYKTNIDLDECFLWIDENLPNEYQGKALQKAYERLSRADVFKGRIHRWQHWDFLIHINMLLTSGIAFAKEETNPTTREYKRSSRILKVWMAKQRYAKKRSICEKIAEKTHTSKKRALHESFPYLQLLLFSPATKAELELNEEEVNWLQKKK